MTLTDAMTFCTYGLRSSRIKENTIRLAAAVVFITHITIIGLIRPKGALASALFPLAALEVNWMMLPIGWPDAPKVPENSAFTSPAHRQIKMATMIHRSALADVDHSKDLGMRRLASIVSSAIVRSAQSKNRC